MFPQVTELGLNLGIPTIPVFVFVIVGATIGILFQLLSPRIGKKAKRVLKSLSLAYILWFVTGIVIAIASEDGSIAQRIGRGDVIRYWFSTFYLLVLILPGLMGLLAILNGTKSLLSGTLAVLISIAVASMVYSEAAGNELLSQSLLLSLVTVWGLVLFVEGMDIIRRLEEYKEGPIDPGIINRNLFFVLLFLTISSILSAIATVIDTGGPIGIYELRTIHGKAALGLALLAPLGILVLIRRRR